MAHILLDQLVSFHKNNLLDPQGYHYDSNQGMWISNDEGGGILVKATDSNKPKVGSKKCDVETGEDMKGQ